MDNENLLDILLLDRTTGKNVIWATDNYEAFGEGFQSKDHITAEAINGERGCVVKPRNEKSKSEQTERIRAKAEVFTPSWICNKQNNLIDNAWFEKACIFNTEGENSWTATTGPISFPTVSGKTWQDYVLDTRLEITCGEAPYLVSRYDTVTGEKIAIPERIGLLDRKLRVVSENCGNENDWIKWAKTAFQNTYGFDWQGDNVILARNNLMLTFIEYYQDRFGKKPSNKLLAEIAEIVSWNIWQMDGLKFIVPESEHDVKMTFYDLLGEYEEIQHYEGDFSVIMDWKTGEKIKFADLVKGDVSYVQL